MGEPTINLEEWRAGIDTVLEQTASNWRPRNSAWTEREIAVLERYYGTVAVRVLAQQLGRSVNSVYKKAQTLGIVNPSID